LEKPWYKMKGNGFGAGFFSLAVLDPKLLLRALPEAQRRSANA